jgi:dTDP-4-dehydrorhamnose 3,5-epimerase
MKVLPTDLPEVLVLEARVFDDARGRFQETWRAERYEALGLRGPFAQDNASESRLHVVRGLHYQWPQAQGKLITVLRGAVYDVALDIRRGSPSFGRWVGLELTAESGRQLWIPAGFAHGFAALTDGALLSYKCTAPYVAEAEGTVRWDDPALGIAWPVETPVLSPKDAAAPALAAIPAERLPAYGGVALASAAGRER